jgi:hypothetical protein
MGGILGQRLQGADYDLFDLGIADAAGCAGTGFIQQSVRTVPQKAGSPLAYGLLGELQLASHLGVAVTGGAGQYQASALG